MKITEPEKTSTTKTNNKDVIDLILVAKILWNGRRMIFKSILIGFALGLVFALLWPKEYTTSTTMVPQTSQDGSNKLGRLSSLAAMAGFNLNTNSNSESLSPMVYPQIVQSVPFQLELMNTPFQIKGIDHPVSLFEYYTQYKGACVWGTIKKYTIGLLDRPSEAKSGEQNTTAPISSGLITLTKDQDIVHKKLEDKLSMNTNDKEGYLTLSASFHDPLLAAQVAQKAQDMLQRYITTFKIQKAKEQLDFISGRFNEKKKEFEQAQERLARFRDQNKNVSSALAQTEEERLKSEYNIAFSVYSELAKQQEQAQIQVKQDTPILTIIEPVRVPLEKSKPNRPFILFIGIVLGGMVGTGIVFGHKMTSNIKQRWNEERE